MEIGKIDLILKMSLLMHSRTQWNYENKSLKTKNQLML